MDKCGACFFCANSECLQSDSKSSTYDSREISINQSKDQDAAIRFSLGSRYVNASLSRWNKNQNHVEAVSRWMSGQKNMLVLIGPPNTGKTYFCAAIANFLLQQQKNIRFYNPRRFFEEIQKTISAGQNQYYPIKAIAESPVLIFDDVGASTNSEWQKEVLLDLVDQRYSSNLPTIITSNLEEKAMISAFGERTARRIFSPDNLILTLGNEYVR